MATDRFAAVRRPVGPDVLPPPWNDGSNLPPEFLVECYRQDHVEHGAPFGDTIRGTYLWWNAQAWIRNRAEQIHGREHADKMPLADIRAGARWIAENAPWVVDDSLPEDGKVWDA